MAALADHDAPHAQLLRRLLDAQRDLAHLLVVADEEAEVAGLAGLGAERPGDARGVEDLGVADQAFDMRFGEEVGRGRDQHHLGARLVEREAHVQAGLFLGVFFQAGQRVCQGRLGDAQVVADAVHLADDLVGVLLAQADRVHDLARGHRDLGGVDAVGAEDRAAAALRALVVVGPPVVEHVLGHVGGADQLGEMLAGEREVAAVDAAHQVLPRHRHVLRVAGAEEVVALVGAGAAVHAGVHVDLQRAVLAEQLAHLGRRRAAPSRRPVRRGSRSAAWIIGDATKGLLCAIAPTCHQRDHRVGLELGGLEGAVAMASWRLLLLVAARRPRPPRGASRASCRPGCASG